MVLKAFRDFTSLIKFLKLLNFYLRRHYSDSRTVYTNERCFIYSQICNQMGNEKTRAVSKLQSSADDILLVYCRVLCSVKSVISYKNHVADNLKNS